MNFIEIDGFDDFGSGKCQKVLTGFDFGRFWKFFVEHSKLLLIKIIDLIPLYIW